MCCVLICSQECMHNIREIKFSVSVCTGSPAHTPLIDNLKKNVLMFYCVYLTELEMKSHWECQIQFFLSLVVLHNLLGREKTMLS